MTMTSIRLLPVLLPLTLLLAPPAQAEKVGVTAAVNPQATGKPPSAAERTLHVGIDMQADERVVTSGDGRVQLLFMDGSGLSVGPNSQVSIDKFVYDPSSKKGELNLSAAKGVFRFVGGKISKTEEVKIATPSGTIGIRGGIAAINIAPNGQTTANFLFGQQMTMTQGGQTQTTTRPGTAIDAKPNEPPSPPRMTTDAELQQVNNSMQTQGGGQTTSADPVPGGGGREQIQGRIDESGLGDHGSNGQLPAPPKPIVLVPVDDRVEKIKKEVIDPVIPTPDPVVPIEVTSSPGVFIGGISVAFEPVETLYYQATTKILQSDAADAIALEPVSDTVQRLRLRVSDGERLFTPSYLLSPEGYFLAIEQDVIDGFAELSAEGTYCECEYQKWGFWNVAFEENTAGRVAIGTMIVGTPTVAERITTNNVEAVYYGAMAGVVMDGGDVRGESGYFEQTFNFQSRRFVAGNSEFDHKAVTFETTSMSGNKISGRLTAAGGYSGTYSGAFFGPVKPNGTPPEVGGNFSLQGDGYKAGGIFGGSQTPPAPPS